MSNISPLQALALLNMNALTAQHTSRSVAYSTLLWDLGPLFYLPTFWVPGSVDPKS